MAVTSVLTMSVSSGDGSSGSTNLVKSVPGISFAGTTPTFSFPQIVGVAPPATPLPTTTLAAPGTVTPTAQAGGALIAGTYYYRVTALNAVGETTGSAEVSITTTGSNNAVVLTWSAVTGATSYKVYRGATAGGESVYYAAASNSYTDIGGSGTAGTVPVSNTTQLSAPGTVTPTPSGSGGTLAANTYYYKVTALNAAGETTGSPETSGVTTSGSSSSVALAWTAVTGATSYRIYRGTAAGSENVYYTNGTASFTDTGGASTGGTVPGANTTQVAAPGTITPTAQAGGTLSAATYYYKVTALNATGETTGSTEANVTTTGSTSAVSLTWAAIAGATSYKVYRGTSAAAENVFYTTSTNSYLDTNASSTAGTVPTSNTTGVSGSMAAGTYYVKTTYVNAPQGESLPSSESALLTVLASGAIQIPSPAASGSAASYNVYITPVNGSTNTETKQNATPIAIGSNYTQTAAYSAGAALPGSNTTLTWIPTLPITPVQVAYLRNTGGTGQVATLNWTAQGGSSVKILDLIPGAGIAFSEPTAGIGQGGITALSITAATVLTPVESFFAG